MHGNGHLKGLHGHVNNNRLQETEVMEIKITVTKYNNQHIMQDPIIN